MDWISTISILVAIVILTFILLFFTPKPKVFFDPYVDLSNFVTYHKNIELEILTDTSTAVIPIYGLGVVKSDKYAVTYEVLRSVPCIRFTGIINLKTRFHQAPRYGYYKIANNTLRYFYCIKAPNQKAGICIDGQKKFFESGQIICCDVSREYSMFNKSKTDITTLLFMDIDRPPNINIGNSPNKELKKDDVLKMFVELENDEGRVI